MILQTVYLKFLYFITILNPILNFFIILIKDFSPILALWISFRAFSGLSAKDKKDLDIKSIEQSYEDAEKLIELLEKIEEILDNPKSDLEIQRKQFKKFIFHLEHICVLILSKTVNDQVFKYKYAIPIRNLYNSDFIKEMHEILELPFDPEVYQWLEDTYKLAIHKKLIKK